GLAVQTQPQAERSRVGDLVGGNDPGTHRAAAIEALALEELLVPRLHLARRDIVDDSIAEDMARRVLFRDGLATAARDIGQLDLVIQVRCYARVERDLVLGAADGRDRLGEEYRILGQLWLAAFGAIGFDRVGDIVHPQADHILARARDGRQQPHRAE